jgi:hypothetical protein
MRLGVILPTSDARASLVALPQQTRQWGGVAYPIGNPPFAVRNLEDIHFELYPVTPHVLGLLPHSLRIAELTYAAVDATALEEYDAELRLKPNLTEGIEEQRAPHRVELALAFLLEPLSAWALMFVPPSDRLGNAVRVNTEGAIQMLRAALSHSSDEGFLAIRQEGDTSHKDE